MPVRQYAFDPQEHDPRIDAQRHWEDLRDELNVTRDQLESSNAQCTSQAALIDMLRQELSETKSACAIIERSNTVMRTKLQAAGMLVLDALKTDEIERGAVVSEFAVKSNVQPIHDEPKVERPAFLRMTAPPENQWPSGG